MTGVIEVRRRGFQKRVCRLAPRMRQYWRSSRETRTSPMPSSLHEKMFAMRRTYGSYGERDETNSSQSRNAGSSGEQTDGRGWFLEGGVEAVAEDTRRRVPRRKGSFENTWSLGPYQLCWSIHDQSCCHTLAWIEVWLNVFASTSFLCLLPMCIPIVREPRVMNRLAKWEPGVIVVHVNAL